MKGSRQEVVVSLYLNFYHVFFEARGRSQISKTASNCKPERPPVAFTKFEEGADVAVNRSTRWQPGPRESDGKHQWIGSLSFF